MTTNKLLLLIILLHVSTVFTQEGQLMMSDTCRDLLNQNQAEFDEDLLALSYCQDVACCSTNDLETAAITVFGSCFGSDYTGSLDVLYDVNAFREAIGNEEFVGGVDNIVKCRADVRDAYDQYCSIASDCYDVLQTYEFGFIFNEIRLYIKNNLTIPVNPSGWKCEQYRFDDGRCDCSCGAHDTDCDDHIYSILSCGENCESTCLSGECVQREKPELWDCDMCKYNFSNECDCGCGAPDPDCTFSPLSNTVVGCDSCEDTCNENGTCVTGKLNVSGWTCSPCWYQAGDGCNCGCGAFDPDCNLAGAVVYGCETGQICDRSGMCCGVRNS
eukprot:TRINITY_DN2653_c0_g3_i1.p1 TRINITY_DN2653_c0_g3~~TRINITY_DN2653_c0_g3_i1.p1  ORF type:complete len:340 (-),score=63.97 TRINITY_DN2653_c0_g3_i1:515-1501(-)